MNMVNGQEIMNNIRQSTALPLNYKDRLMYGGSLADKEFYKWLETRRSEKCLEK